MVLYTTVRSSLSNLPFLSLPKSKSQSQNLFLFKRRITTLHRRSSSSLQTFPMNSLFNSRRPERSGGKIVRSRTERPSASPYLRLESGKRSPSPRSFLGGLISGAGKLISSVLPSSANSTSYEDDEEEYSTTDEDDNDLPSQDCQELNERGKGAVFNNNCMDGPSAVILKTESKRAIAQLLMQETFSRDECDKLIKLIQSRVVDFPSAQVCGSRVDELPHQANGDSGAFKQTPKYLENFPYSSSKLNAFSPASSTYEERTPDICKRAVMEAKKWLEEKKLASNSKSDSDCGPCMFNSCMLHYDIEGVLGSPVDVAKSYMQSLPPWRSPSISNIEFITPPSSAKHHYKSGTSSATMDYSLSSSKFLKRGHVDIGSWDTLDETRRVRQRATDNELNMLKSKQIESSARLLEHESSIRSSDSPKTDLNVGDLCLLGALRMPDGRGELKIPLETDNVNSPNIILEPAETINSAHANGSSLLNAHLQVHEETLNAAQVIEETVEPPEHINSANIISDPEETINILHLTNGSSIPHPPEPTHSLGDNLDVEELSHIMEQSNGERVDAMAVPHGSHHLASRSVKHDEISLPEVKLGSPEGNQSAGPGHADDAANANDVHTCNLQTIIGGEGILEADKSCQFHLASVVEVANSNSDTRSQEGNSQIPSVANGSISEFSGNGSFSGVNTKSDHETLSNGTRMKSIERMLTEPKPTTVRRRRKKTVVKSRMDRERS